jgi:hypothetical protein
LIKVFCFLFYLANAVGWCGNTQTFLDQNNHLSILRNGNLLVLETTHGEKIFNLETKDWAYKNVTLTANNRLDHGTKDPKTGLDVPEGWSAEGSETNFHVYRHLNDGTSNKNWKITYQCSYEGGDGCSTRLTDINNKKDYGLPGADFYSDGLIYQGLAWLISGNGLA